MPHWLIIDLEATTDEGGWPVTEMEVIEIGASLVNRQGRERDHFQRFVRPQRRPLLTPFCRKLTHITQANMDGAAPFSEVWALFERWLGQLGRLRSPAARTGVAAPWPEQRAGPNAPRQP